MRQFAYLTEETFRKIEEKGRPTLLFFPNLCPWENMPDSVRTYIQEGERKGLPGHALISTRKPWCKMETRAIPSFLFAYLGRRNARFIRNEAKVLPLTGFLCVYPHSKDKEYIEKLWTILQHPSTISNLHLVGKSYGSGAVKVEPGFLAKLPINSELVKEVGLNPMASQLDFRSL